MRRVALIWGGTTAILAAVVGFLSYQAGWAAGAATRLPVGAVGPGPYYGYYAPHFWGFGFGLLPLLLVLLVVWLGFRAARWRRGWGPGGWGPGGWYGQYPGAAQQQPPPPAGAQQPPPAAGDPLHDWPQRPGGGEPGAGRTPV